MKVSEKEMTRRRFLQTTALASAAVSAGSLLASCSKPVVVDPSIQTPEIDDSPVDFYNTMCHGCLANCPVRAYVKDGVVVKLEGHPEGPISQGSMCVKGLNQLHTCYSPRRILYPMKRVSPRGAANAKFERISWEEAVELASDKIVEAIEKYNTYAILSSTGGGGSYTLPRGAGSFAFAFGAPNMFEPGCAQCLLPRALDANLMWGGPQTSISDSSAMEPLKGLSEAAKADGLKSDMSCLVLWGAQPSASNNAQAGRGLADMRANGTKTIVVDPRFSPDASKADIHLPLRPGSDVALALAWWRVIIDEKLYDEEFTKFYTNLPFLINPKTHLPWLATEVFGPDAQTTPDDTPVYVCVDEKTGKVAPLPFGFPEDIKEVVDPQVLATAVVNGLESKSAGQIWRDEAEPWTLERAEEFCWVPADRIRSAIDLYTHPASGAAGIVHGVATDQMEISSQIPLALLGLDFIMGYVNKPGCTLTNHTAPAADGESPRPTIFPLRSLLFCKPVGVGYEVGASEEANRKRVESVPEKYDPSDEKATKAFTKPNQWAYNQLELDRIGMDKHRGLFGWASAFIPAIREAIETGDPYKISVWCDWSGNKLAVLGSAGSWYNACINGGVDYIIAQHPMLTSFHMELADLVFPVEEWLEETNASGNQGQFNYQFPNPGLVHLGESAPHTVPAKLMADAAFKKLNEKKDKIMFGTTGKTVAELNLEFPIGQGLLENIGTEEALWKSQINIMSKFPGAEEIKTKEEFLAFAKNRSDFYYKKQPDKAYWSYGQHLAIAKDGLPVGFATESRKIEVYCSALIKMSQNGFPYAYPRPLGHIDERVGLWDGDYSPIARIPQQKEAPQVANSSDYIAPFDPDFPLAITSGRLFYFHHGTMRHSPYARELYPEPFVSINPETAAEYGIESGDWVEISSRRTVGKAYDPQGMRGTEMALTHVKEHNTKTAEPIHAIANVTEEVAPKVLWMERFWNPECYDSSRKDTKTGGWQECNINVLSNAIDTNFNEVYGSYNNRAFAVQIKKSSRPAGVWVEPKEFQPFMPTTPNEYVSEIGVLRDNAAMITEIDPYGGDK